MTHPVGHHLEAAGAASLTTSRGVVIGGGPPGPVAESALVRLGGTIRARAR